MSVLNHPLITERYFFPRPLAVANPAWVDVEHGRLACYATQSGHPLTVVHFHGNGEVVADYVPDFVEMINELGADCFLAEYRGYGASGGVPQLGKMLDDVEAIFHAVGRPPEELIVFGRSVGSIYAIEFAHRYPNVSGLILESAIAEPLERILMRMTPAELGMSLSCRCVACRTPVLRPGRERPAHPVPAWGPQHDLPPQPETLRGRAARADRALRPRRGTLPLSEHRGGIHEPAPIIAIKSE